jgi:threonine synthase
MSTVTLGEGHTPLVPSVQIGPKLGLNRLYFKLDNTNPSGSYKDRFAAAQVGHVLALGAKACLATSSGNTGSALAAYCARYSLPCVIVVGDATPAGKLAQMQAHGARVLRVKDYLSSPSIAQKTLGILSAVAAERSMSFVVSAYRYCPEGMA